jgi:hypothetical protein
MAWTKKLLRMALVIGCGLLLYKVALPRTVEAVWAVPAKLRGKAPGCSWGRIFSITSGIMRFGELRKALKQRMSVADYDATLDIERISSPQRAFWIPKEGTAGNGEDLLNYLLAEQDWVLERAGESAVQRGDIVLDCGGHVGTFTHKALELGAARLSPSSPIRYWSNAFAVTSRRRSLPDG